MALVQLLGDKVKGKDGGDVDVAGLSDNDVVGLYFSAHWCPPCKAFTPVLAEFYTKLRGNGKKLEIVFVSSDKDEASCADYYNLMPWLVLPYSNREKKNELAQKYQVRGIPTLVLVDAKSGEVITLDGRGTVSKDPNGDKFPWK